jgi:hypothetical protein
MPEGQYFKLLRMANDALRAGEPREEVEDRIRRASGGRIQSISHLQALVKQEAAEAPPEEVLEGETGRPTFETFQESARQAAALGAHGFTFGFSDELADILPGGRTGEEQRAFIEAAREEDPAAAFLSELAGGIALPMGAAVSGARAIGTGGGIAARMGRGVLAGGGVGALSGGLYGAGEAEGSVGERLPEAGVGAAIGGVLGGALGAGLPLLGAGARYGGRLVSEALSPERAGQAAAKRQLGRAMSEAGLTTDELAELLGREAGATPADVSPTLARQAQAATAGAPGTERVGGPVDILGQRHGGRAERLSEALHEAIGSSKTYTQARREAEQELLRLRKQFYAPLDEQFTDDVPIADVLVDVASGNKPIFDALRRVRPESFEDGRVPFKAAQQVLESLRDDVSEAARKGRKFDAQQAREAREIWRELMSGIPGFDDAQKNLAPMYERIEGMMLGRRSFRLSSTDLQDVVEGMSDEQLSGFKQGWLDKAEEAIRKESGIGQVTRRPPEIMDRFRIVIGDQDAFEQFAARAEIEGRWARTYSRVSPAAGSPTAPLSADMSRGMPYSKFDILNRILTAFFDNSQARTRAAGEIAEVLLKQGPEAAEELAARLATRWGAVGRAGATFGQQLAGPVSLPAVAGKQGGGLFDLFGSEIGVQ